MEITPVYQLYSQAMKTLTSCLSLFLSRRASRLGKSEAMPGITRWTLTMHLK